jgi:hypothetical protein
MGKTGKVSDTCFIIFCTRICTFDASVQDCKKFVLETHLNYTFYTNLCKPILGQENFNNNDIT